MWSSLWQVVWIVILFQVQVLHTWIRRDRRSWHMTNTQVVSQAPPLIPKAVCGTCPPEVRLYQKGSPSSLVLMKRSDTVITEGQDPRKTKQGAGGCLTWDNWKWPECKKRFPCTRCDTIIVTSYFRVFLIPTDSFGGRMCPKSSQMSLRFRWH